MYEFIKDLNIVSNFDIRIGNIMTEFFGSLCTHVDIVKMYTKIIYKE